MQTRSMTRKLAEEKIQKADSTPHFDENEYHMFCYNRKEYEKEQKRRRLAGVTPIIICMGGPYQTLGIHLKIKPWLALGLVH